MSICGQTPESSSLTWSRSMKLVWTFMATIYAITPSQTDALQAQEIQSTPVLLGYRDYNFGGSVTSEPTEEKPESKIWFQDNFWWGVLWDDTAAEFRIHRLDLSTQNWTNTGTTVDSRRRSAADVLVDGNKVYIASRAKINVHSSDSKLATLSRYTYNSGSNTYSLDTGFPINIPGTNETKALTIAKDSNDKIWAVWTDTLRVHINSTNGTDTNWGSAFVLPVEGSDVLVQDISAIIAFNGDRIGILWSNQNDDRIYFAVHHDTSATANWQPREIVFSNGGNAADDHLNLAVRPSDGTVLAVTKTSFTVDEDPSVLFHRRDPSTGVWTNHTAWLREQDPTRPIVVYNSDDDHAYIIVRDKLQEGLYVKHADVDNPVFPGGDGEMLVRSLVDIDLGNPSSTKQTLNNATGLVVLGSAKDQETYLHGYLPFNNTRPVASDDVYDVNQGTTKGLPVVSNDTDSDGTVDGSTIAIVSGPLHGSVTISVDSLDYTPDPGYAGGDTLRYTVRDDDGANAVAATVLISVNAAPVALDDSGASAEDTPIDIAVLANDTDADSAIDPATVTVISGPGNGATTLNSTTGVLTYTPNPHFSGSDSFSYTVADDSGAVSNAATVSLIITEINDPPFANDDNVTTDNATPILIDLLANDVDVDGTIIVASLALTQLPLNGTAVLNSATGEVTYTPNPSFFGNDSLKYTVVDDQNAISDEGTAHVLVNSVPLAIDDTTVTQQNTAVVINVLANDSDPDGSLDPATVAVQSSPSQGATTVNPTTGQVTYTPNSGYVGPDQFTYLAKDESGVNSNVATVRVKVNQPPTTNDDNVLTLKATAIDIDILANDIDTDGTLDSSSIQVLFGPFNANSFSINPNTGVVSYNPKPLFSGQDIFEYELRDNDGALSNKATVTVRVNDPPVAHPDAAITNEDTPVIVVVTPNDTDSDGTLVPTSVAIATPPANGTATVDAGSGTITYTPAQDHFGTDSFTYSVADNDGTPSNAATVTLTINDINDPPVAVSDTAATTEDQAVQIAVIANDIDVDGTLSATGVTAGPSAPHGTVSVNPVTGVITYTPHQDFFGQDTFTYTVVDDDNATSNAGTVIVNIALVNDAPVANDDAGSTNEDTPVDVNVVANDTDLDGTVDVTSVAIAGQPANGSVSVDANNGLISYTPDLNFFGSDSFTYTVDDNDGATSNAGTVTITVADVNDAPVAVNDTSNGLFNAPFDIDVTGNDIDVDGTIQPHTILASSGAHGTTSIQPSGVITYTPSTGFIGEDTFFYSVRDDDGAASNTATVTVLVKVPPVAVNDSVVTNEDVAIAIPVTANDSDQDGTLDLATVTIVSGPTNGTTTINTATGAVTYTPASNYNGIDTFEYTVDDDDGVTSNLALVQVTVNKAPIALNDSKTTDEDTPTDIDVAANDIDLDGSIDPTTVTVLTPPTNGSFQLNHSTGIIVYTPALNFSGTDVFTYQVQDNHGVSTNAATATITVNPVNDPPVAGSDVVTTNKATPVDIDITANDTDIDGTIVEASVLIVAQPGNGTISVNPTDGVVTYQPHAFFLGVDTFLYTIEDNNGALSGVTTVTINVTGDNDPPVAVNDTVTTGEELAVAVNVPANDVDLDGSIDLTSVTILLTPLHGSATLNANTGVVTYQPVDNFSGSDSLSYQVSDNLGAISNEAKVLITVLNVNDAPLAVNDAKTTSEDVPVVINVLANDSDTDGNIVPSTVTVVAAPLQGTPSVNPTTGEITYTPNPNFFGTDSLKYTVKDNDGSSSNPATVNLTVNALNDLPVAAADTVVTSINQALDVNVVANDTDVDGTIDPSTVIVQTPPGNGATSVQANGVVIYTPNPNFGGVDAFIYNVKDNDGGTSNPALVRVTIIAPPIVANDSVATNEDNPIGISVLANDTDVDGTLAPATVNISAGPTNGQTALNPATGVVTFTPNPNFFGLDSFTYTVEDNDGNVSDPATAKINVLPVNDLPVAVNDTSITPEDTPVAISVTVNDSDIDGTLNFATLVVTGGPSNGQAIVNPSNGTIAYTPNPNYNGPDLLTYVIQDNSNGTSNQATVSITVTQENDLPVATDDAATTNEDVAIAVDVVANDFDPDGTLDVTSVTIQTPPAQGSATVNATTGVITYTPGADFFGSDSLDYIIRDNLGVASNPGRVRLTVNPLNDPPRANDDIAATLEDTPIAIPVTANDVDIDGSLNLSTLTLTSNPQSGSLNVNSGTGVITYTPAANFNGQDGFTYIIQDNDGLVSNQATVTVTIAESNDVPVAQDDAASTNEDVSVLIAVAGNDSDSDGSLDLTSVAVTTPPTNGSAEINPTTGSITYRPADNFNGVDSLKYTIQDDKGDASNVATVSITINSVNDLPVAANDTSTTIEDTSVVVNVVANDVDVDGTLDFATLTVTSSPANGTTTINVSTGEITYAPAANFNGQDTFTYTIRDNDAAASNAATVVINVTGQNDVPVALDDIISTDEDVPAVIDILANDNDPDGSLDISTLTITSPATLGSTTIDPVTGAITYTPASNVFGADSLKYQVKDDTGINSNVATVRITVNSVNDLPIALDDTTTTSENTPVVVSVTANDSDFEGPLNLNTLAVDTAPVNGTTLVNTSTGEITYTPNTGFSGQELFTYTVEDDDGGLSNPANVVITVTAGNRAPLALDDAAATDEDTPVQIDITANDSDSDGSLNLATVQVTTSPAHGTIVVSPTTALVTYTPALDFSGIDTLKYTIEDDLAAVSNEATVIVTISPVNDAPLAADDQDSTFQNTPVVVDVPANDSDPDGSLALNSVTVTNNPLNGAAVVNAATGGVTYTPNNNFVGQDEFTYTINDDSGATSNEATVRLHVKVGNAPPVAVDDQASTPSGTVVAIDVMANDNDPDGTLDITSVAATQPANGGVTVNPTTGVVSYTPNALFTGLDAFTYTVNDDQGAASNVATVTITVTQQGGGQTLTFESIHDGQIKFTEPGSNYGAKSTMKVDGGKFGSYLKFVVGGLNGAVTSAKVRLKTTDGPSAGGDNGGSIFTVSNNFKGTGIPWVEGTLTFGNAPDAGGSPLSTLGAVSPSELVEFDVTSAVTGNGTFSFAVIPNSGNQVKFYTKEGLVKPELLVVTGSGGGNQAPVAGNDVSATLANTPIAIDVTANDSDSDGLLDIATISVDTAPLNGTTSVNGTTGLVTYTPNTAFTGIDTFTYTVQDDDGAPSNVATVTVTVSGGNQPPLAVDDNASADSGVATTVDVTANDADSDGSINVTSVTITGQPFNGTAIVNAGTGVVTYTSNAQFVGTDTFTYTVDDNLGATSNTATVTVSVTSPGSGQTLVFQSTDDGQVKVTELGSNYGAKSTMKVDGGKFNSYLKFVVSGASGAVTSAKVRLKITDGASDGGDNGGSIFLVDNNFAGTALPWVEGTLTSGNAPPASGAPLATLGAVSPSQTVEYDVSGAISGNGVFSFAITPNSGNQVKFYTKEGSVAPELVIKTGSGGGNQAPVAVNDNASTAAGTAIGVDVTANDTDADGTVDVTTVAVASQPANGTLAVNSVSGVVTYTPNSGFSGSDTFTYSVKDNDGAASNAATVTVQVIGANVPPVAVADNAATTDGNPVEINVTANDTDSDDGIDVTTVSVTSGPTNGSATVNSTSGAVTYTPNTGFTGTDSFTYTVNDNSGATSNPATVTITVDPAGGGATFTFNAVDDGQVKLTDPGANYGNKVTMKVDGGKFSSYMKFVVTGVTGAVTSAKVQVRITDGLSDGGDSGGSIFRVDNNFLGTGTPWSETTLTSGNAPATSGSPLETRGPVAPNETVEFDVTGSVTGNGTFSFAITPQSTNEIKFFTSEGTVSPKLVVTTGSGGGGGNQAPVASNDNATTSQDVPVIVDVIANDTDSDGSIDPSTVTVVSGPTNGSATVNTSSGVVTYAPNGGFSGSDSFDYTVSDNDGALSNTATVTITVESAGSGDTFTFISTDDGQVKLTETGKKYGSKGTMKINAGKFESYLKFSVTGLGGAVQSAKVRLRVTDGLSDGGPGGSIFRASNNHTGTATPWTEVTLNGANAPDVVSSALHTAGTVVPSQIVEFDVTSAVSGNGEVSFCLTTAIGNEVKYFTRQSDFEPELVIVTGSGGSSNNAPVAVNDQASTATGTPVSVNVTSNDTDSDGIIDNTTVAIVSQPANGSTSVNGATGAVTYTPNSGFAGTDTFTYTVRDNDGATSNAATVSVAVSGSNLPPVAVNDVANTVAGLPIAIDVTLNDSDTDGTINVLTVAIASAPVNGTATIGNFGIVNYTPASGFTGTDSFTYTVQDNDGAASNAATVTVTVQGSGGPQTLVFDATDDGQVKLSDPVANYGSKGTMKVERGKFSTYFKFVVTGLTGPVQSATVRLRVTNDPADGSDQGGSIFQASNNFTGTATPWQEATLTSGNAPDLTGGALETLGEVIPSTFVEFDVTSAVSGNGTFSFCISSTSGNQVKYYTKEGTSIPSDQLPKLIVSTGTTTVARLDDETRLTASDDSVVTEPGVAISINVLDNDRVGDRKLAAGSVAAVTLPQNGAVSVDEETGALIYSPNAGFKGTDSFDYIVSAGNGESSNPARVVVTVKNVALQTTDDSAKTFAGLAIEIPVVANDATAGTILITQPAEHGTISVDDRTNLVTYQSDNDFTGDDGFEYKVANKSGELSNAATVTINVLESQPQIIALLPTDDAFVRASAPTDNFGAADVLRATNGRAEFYSFLKFRVENLTAAIQTATLRLYLSDDSEGGAVYSVGNTYRDTDVMWREDGLVWDNAPEISGHPIATFVSEGSRRYVEIEITKALNGAGVYSFGLAGLHDSDAVKYDSKEAIHPPELIVETGARPADDVTTDANVDGGDAQLPESVSLRPNFPNPFNPETNIIYALPQNADVKLEIYNIRGQLVRTLVNGAQKAGLKRTKWFGVNDDGAAVASGIYFMRLEVGNTRFSRRIILQK